MSVKIKEFKVTFAYSLGILTVSAFGYNERIAISTATKLMVDAVKDSKDFYYIEHEMVNDGEDSDD